MENSHGFRRWVLLGLMMLGLATAGCQGMPDPGLSCPASEVVYHGFILPPRLRWGTTACVVPRTPFLGADLGGHGYYMSLAEKDGIAYTCRGGHIDTMHVRIAADWTAYLAARSFKHLMRGDPAFSYKMIADRSRHYVQVSYPPTWQSLSPGQRRETAREVALLLGPYLAYSMITWHEIITWHGFRSVGIVGEYQSAFSWEDGYSNLLGTVIAAKVLRDTQHSYDEAMKMAFDEEMRALGVQPVEVCRQASESVKGTWYTGNVGMTLKVKKRNLDTGWDDGFVTPSLVPNLPACRGAVPMSYPAPTLAILAKYGFAATVEIEPHEWEKGKVLRIVYPNGHGKRICPDVHFAPIMAHIRQEVVRKYGPDPPDGSGR
jgi:hypothetical protein